MRGRGIRAGLSVAVFILAALLGIARAVPGTAPGGLTVSQVFDPLGPSQLEIRNYPVAVGNNWGGAYDFTMSVLALSRGDRFLPLLAIAIESGDGPNNSWLAAWNLGDDSPGLGQRLKSLFPGPWSPRSDVRREPEGNDPFSFPRPCLVATSRKEGSWRRVGWGAGRRLARYADLFNPFRFLLNNYVHYHNDMEDRKFHQLYTLIRLYEDAAALNPSPEHLSPPALVDLKYQLLINRRALGVLMESESRYEVVKSYESKLRVQMGKAASFLHAQANLHHLGFQSVAYGLPGRPPVSHAALIYIRKADLPEQLPPWSSRNVFDLGHNPYTHPEVRELMDRYPEEEIPLAFYVLASDFNFRPIIVADFFRPGSVRRRESTATVRVGLENLLAAYRLPLLYRTLHRVADYGMDKKASTAFSDTSTAAGVEALRLFARLDWKFDTDTNYMLLRSLENRVANPLAESYAREASNARLNFAQLLNGDARQLALKLRRLFEDRVRDELDLGNRAIFAAEYRRFREEREYQAAQRLVEDFGGSQFLTGYSWDRLMEAWEIVSRRDPEKELPASDRFISRLEKLDPDMVPEDYRTRVAEILYPRQYRRAERAEVTAPAGRVIE